MEIVLGSFPRKNAEIHHLAGYVFLMTTQEGKREQIDIPLRRYSGRRGIGLGRELRTRPVQCQLGYTYLEAEGRRTVNTRDSQPTNLGKVGMEHALPWGMPGISNSEAGWQVKKDCSWEKLA